MPKHLRPISGVMTDMLKNLPEEGIALLTTHIQEFWENKECDYDTWHKTELQRQR